MKTDILDALISIAIILFILSVIVEKITQLIRQYSPFIKPKKKKKKGLSSYWQNINNKQEGNTPFDKKIEREVTSLSFAIGSLIAVLFRVDLFKMISSDDPRKVLFWNDVDYSNTEIALFFISIPLTGFFLSFGSKFFHDILDTLLQVKNLKRKMVDEETYNVDSVQQLDDYLNKTYTDIIRTAIAQNRNSLQPAEATSPPLHGKIKRNGAIVDCIDVHLSGNNRGSLPQSVQVKLESGKIANVIVNAIYNVEIPKVMAVQGDTNANEQTASFKGTICCKINKNGADRLLTCSHIYTGGTAENNFGDIAPSPARINNTPNGDFVWAICTDQLDVALLAPSTTAFDYTIPPQQARKPVLSDILHTHVRVVCRDNQIKKGVVVNNRSFDPIEIEYKGGVKHSLSNLLIISDINEEQENPDYSRVTIPGDSGACVYDSNGSPIGMIVAGNNKFSYAIPIVDILDKLTATITK